MEYLSLFFVVFFSVNVDNSFLSRMGEVSPLLQLVFEKEKKQTKQITKPVDILDYLLDAKNFDINLLQSFHGKYSSITFIIFIL